MLFDKSRGAYVHKDFLPLDGSPRLTSRWSSSDLLLSQVFQNNPTTFKGWNSPGLQAEELSDEQKRAIGLRFQELGQNFSDGNSVDPQALKNAYPWIPFVVKVRAF